MKMSKVGVISLLALTFTITVLGAQQYKLIINGEQIAQEVIVKDGVTYVPLRVVSEKLGATVAAKDGVITVNSTSQTTISTPVTSTQSTPQVTLPETTKTYTSESTQVSSAVVPQDVAEKIFSDKIKNEFKNDLVSFDIKKESDIKYVADVIYTQYRSSQKMKTIVWLDILRPDDMINYYHNGGNKDGYEFGRSSTSYAAE